MVMRIFEQNPGVELTHKQISTLLDARDGRSRQIVFDSLSVLANKKAILRINHHTYKLAGSDSLLEGTISITQRGAGFVTVQGHPRDIYIGPSNVGQALHLSAPFKSATTMRLWYQTTRVPALKSRYH